MDCKRFLETVDLYVDHELAPEAENAAHLHTQECYSCGSVSTALLSLRRQMKSVVALHQPPADLLEAVQRIGQSRWGRSAVRNVRGAQWKPPSTWRRTRTVSLSLAVLLITLFVIYEGRTVGYVIWLRSHNPTSTSLMESRTQESRRNGRESRREQTWMPIEGISAHLQRAVIASEDPNFTRHGGFDYQAIQKAWEQEQRAARDEAMREGDDGVTDFKRGGSTISQQLAKNLFLSSERSVARKTREAVITFFLERSLSKRRILELYLNVIEWGDGVYGAESASQHYFQKSAAALSPEEAAFLAAMIPNPRTILNPGMHPQRVARRQRIILRSMSGAEIP